MILKIKDLIKFFQTTKVEDKELVIKSSSGIEWKITNPQGQINCSQTEGQFILYIK